jgi:hypothetical protein
VGVCHGLFSSPLSVISFFFNDMRYAVGVQTGRLTSGKPDAPAAAWYFVFSFSQKCCILCNIFVKKKGIFCPAGGEISFGDQSECRFLLQQQCLLCMFC